MTPAERAATAVLELFETGDYERIHDRVTAHGVHNTDHLGVPATGSPYVMAQKRSELAGRRPKASKFDNPRALTRAPARSRRSTPDPARHSAGLPQPKPCSV